MPKQISPRKNLGKKNCELGEDAQALRTALAVQAP